LRCFVISDFDEEADKFCPNCDNCWIIDAVTAEDKNKGKLVLELEQAHGAKKKIEVSMDELNV